ncbi:DUF488 domain-containing protein [Candidatus Solincola tengchongensis]|uniref:DUF488 domain-containing protein n=1 Tax=Candidatus Solincola tengchongensis TaxID=2900693 RepID=UPI00257B143F|nr:DUF488 domain-containing protein [Candidatus Solincola tengchongensis]
MQDVHAGKRIFTLGTSTRSFREFLEVLDAWGIRRVCDVRSFPTSRRYPHFSREALSSHLEEHGLDYRWMGELLGGYRKGGYRVHMETPEFRKGIEELEKAAEETATAVVCAELLPWRCHRRFIAEALESRGWEVVHVLDARRSWLPRASGLQTSLLPDGPENGARPA